MTKFRHHRGSLSASMETVVEVAGIAELVGALHAAGWEPGKIEIMPYGFDDRIGWDTYIVTVDGAAAGFTDGRWPSSDRCCTMSNDELQVALAVARAKAQSLGSQHSYWDLIADAEAHLQGRPSQAILSRNEVEQLLTPLVKGSASADL